jgi:hypothetical protein
MTTEPGNRNERRQHLALLPIWHAHHLLRRTSVSLPLEKKNNSAPFCKDPQCRSTSTNAPPAIAARRRSRNSPTPSSPSAPSAAALSNAPSPPPPSPFRVEAGTRTATAPPSPPPPARTPAPQPQRLPAQRALLLPPQRLPRLLPLQPQRHPNPDLRRSQNGRGKIESAAHPVTQISSGCAIMQP